MRMIAIAVLCSGLATAWAADPAPAEASTEALIEKLGSASYAEREAASAAIVKRGEDALAAIRTAADSHADPEVRDRAAAIALDLGKVSVSAKLLAVKPVRFEKMTVSLAAAVAEFKSKTGIPIMLAPGKVADPNRIVTIPAGEFRPWEALEMLLKVAQLTEEYRAEFPPPSNPQNRNYSRWNRWDNDGEAPNYTASSAPIMLADGHHDSLPALRNGSVRVMVLPAGFVANRVVRGSGKVIFHMDIAPLPALGWNVAAGLRVTKAEDDDGRPLFADMKLASNPFQNPYDDWRFGGFGRRVFWNGGGWISNNASGGSGANDNPRLLPVSIRTEDRATPILRKFEGVILGDIHTPNVPVITITDLTKTATYAGPIQTSLTIQDHKKDTNGDVIMNIKYEAMTSWALAQMGINPANFVNVDDNIHNMISTRAKFYDADGKIIPTPMQESSSSSSDGMRQTLEARLRFNSKTTKLPVKMVIVGTKVSQVEVPFKFENVRLP
jgi:hypothetical protein